MKSREVNRRMVIEWPWIHDGRNHGGHAATIGQTQVQDGRIGIQFLAKAIGNHFKASLQCAIVKSNFRQLPQPSLLLHPYGAIGIDHDLRNGLADEEVFNRFQKRDDDLEAHSCASLCTALGSKSIRSCSNQLICTGRKSGLR